VVYVAKALNEYNYPQTFFCTLYHTQHRSFSVQSSYADVILQMGVTSTHCGWACVMCGSVFSVYSSRL
jgi:hypothetical protein